MQTNLTKAHRMSFLVVAAMAMMVSVALASFAEAREAAAAGRTGRQYFVAAVGLQADTPDGTASALGLYGDYYITHEFSIGPLLQMGLTNDFSQVGLTAQAKYTVDIVDFPELKPHVQAGLGFIHADLDRAGGRKENDTSYLMPFGLGAEYQLTNSVLLDSTFLFNFTNLDVRDERFFFSWLIGLKFPF